MPTCIGKGTLEEIAEELAVKGPLNSSVQLAARFSPALALISHCSLLPDLTDLKDGHFTA